MTVAAIRRKIKTFVDGVDDAKVKALYVLLQREIEEADSDFTLTEEELSILDEEHALHTAGKTPSYTWAEAKEMIRGKKLL